MSRRVLIAHALVAAATVAIGCGPAAETERVRPEGSPPSPEPGGGAATPVDGGPPEDALAPTPADGPPKPTAPCAATADDPEGPFYKAGAPERSSVIEDGMPGVRMTLRGHVVAAGNACGGLAGAVVDFWQADDVGTYDNDGYRLRGRARCDANGRYEVRTIVPGHYLNGPQYRPRHIHFIVSAPGYAPLTTQLYFEGDPFNAIDGMFKPELLMRIVDVGDAKSASFDFALVP